MGGDRTGVGGPLWVTAVACHAFGDKVFTSILDNFPCQIHVVGLMQIDSANYAVAYPM